MEFVQSSLGVLALPRDSGSTGDRAQLVNLQSDRGMLEIMSDREASSLLQIVHLYDIARRRGK